MSITAYTRYLVKLYTNTNIATGVAMGFLVGVKMVLVSFLMYLISQLTISAHFRSNTLLQRPVNRRFLFDLPNKGGYSGLYHGSRAQQP